LQVYERTLFCLYLVCEKIIKPSDTKITGWLSAASLAVPFQCGQKTAMSCAHIAQIMCEFLLILPQQKLQHFSSQDFSTTFTLAWSHSQRATTRWPHQLKPQPSVGFAPVSPFPPHSHTIDLLLSSPASPF